MLRSLVAVAAAHRRLVGGRIRRAAMCRAFSTERRAGGSFERTSAGVATLWCRQRRRAAILTRYRLSHG